MTMFFGYKRLTTPDDWRGLAGDEKWVPGRSAYELAHAWYAADGLPLEVRRVLDGSGHQSLRGLAVDLCLIEMPVFLDTRHAPSMTDIMAYGRNAADETVTIAVEGKADEAFGARVAAWVRGGTSVNSPSGPRPSRVRRLAFLAKHLGVTIDVDSNLRYQLLHRTVSAVLEAQLRGAVAALVLVHVFESQTDENWKDFVEFLRAVGLMEPGKGVVVGPCGLGELRDLPTYFLWWRQPAYGEPVRPS